MRWYEEISLHRRTEATINLLERKTHKTSPLQKRGKISNKERTCVTLEDSRRRGPSRDREREREREQGE
ncbi:hypothetical protein AMELA_G00194320 [Ameiurus melas]|uniref:Uncharacterized protein n=1 Tax=Ameiurus melas TaxID=219545 RepID=A0A7J6A5G4_AMEME|nr:hypothetical protein AMELA_G00194320 [Ameiurus melas]